MSKSMVTLIVQDKGGYNVYRARLGTKKFAKVAECFTAIAFVDGRLRANDDFLKEDLRAGGGSDSVIYDTITELTTSLVQAIRRAG